MAASSVALTTTELQTCRQIFEKYDIDKNGSIDVSEIRTALSALGQSVSEEELFLIIHETDVDNSGVIEFDEFIKAISRQKTVRMKSKDEQSTIDAFVAMGGNPDGSGKISVETLTSTLSEFGLIPDWKQIDRNGAEFIEFDDFKSFVD